VFAYKIRSQFKASPIARTIHEHHPVCAPQSTATMLPKTTQWKHISRYKGLHFIVSAAGDTDEIHVSL
jgi:hypothetical protein